MTSEPRWRSLEVPVNTTVSLSMGELLDGWRIQVRRFLSELDSDRDDRGVWGAHDYIGALHLRDALERGLALVGEAERDAAAVLVGKTDREFEGLTEQDRSELLDRFLVAEPSGESWWWKRVPIRGPVRVDLDGESKGHP